MTGVLIAGVAVLDFVFHMEQFPKIAEKYRATGAAISGGGNAANAAVAISRLNGNAKLAARLGDDEIADLIIAGLQRESVDTDLTKRFAKHRSSFSSIYIDATGERQIMNYRDTDLSMDAQWLKDQAPTDIKGTLADTRWPQGALVAMQIAKERGLPGVMDAEAPVMEAIDAVKAASHVAFSAQGAVDFTGETDIEKAALLADTRLDGTVIITDGENGVVMVKDGQPQWFKAFAIQPVDTLGAGDVWHGAFALALAEGQSEADAIMFASAAAALKCTRMGGRDGAPNRDETLEFLRQNT